ncbi:hypothetical protein AMTRI_Chr07g29810 [Amborella trichopoda]|uniref:Ethylene receptor n=1 Tax=Amborella trichopoda TaxID=13333 RepID=W1NIC7_AMBTC|nr:ethylene receptor 2 [Amborella trichopoda]ERM94935.1 hypothetical protein AMTR_s00009p00192200 [Amborella trichopoda]|eukprot:XP_006827519.1 ethylene receptor 2 [Amborella trichopoda]
MLRAGWPGLLISCYLLLSVSATDREFPCSNCDDDGLWSIATILQWQKVSDFLIALAYFSIPLELFYFITCSTVFPFRWVLVQFGAFIVLCGLTHFLMGWSYAPHSFHLVLALTVFKFLTALVSSATSITLVTLIPQLLKVKVREGFLRKKAKELDREVGRIRKRKEASWHVRMLTNEIRKSLDRHTILYTTLVELSKTLALQNCAIWMPNDQKTEMNLTHELKRRDVKLSIPVNVPEVVEIIGSKGVKVLGPDSVLGSASSCGFTCYGSVAAIRMPMLRVSNFKGGTPEMIEAWYAVLVLVLPGEEQRIWGQHELEIVEVVADQVAVALSHAAVLEESQLMREKLVEQNRALEQARRDALMASEARSSFLKGVSHSLRRPMYNISGLLSILQLENLSSEQTLVVDTLIKTSSVLSSLINDIMEVWTIDHVRMGSLELRPFRLHSMVKEAASLARCLFACKGVGFTVRVGNRVPDRVIGDEKRIFQVILHMFGSVLNGPCQGGIDFRVSSEDGREAGQDRMRLPWKSDSSDGYMYLRFEILEGGSEPDAMGLTSQNARKPNSEGIVQGLGFTMCKKLVQMMQGNIWIVPNSDGLLKSISLVVRLQLLPPSPAITGDPKSADKPPAINLLEGLHVLVADDDPVNRAVTLKILDTLGCQVSSVSSGYECLSTLGHPGKAFQVVLLDLYMPDLDGFDVGLRIRSFRTGVWPLVIALTASADEDVKDRCLKIGMNGVIKKPVLLHGMREELLRILEQVTKIT